MGEVNQVQDSKLRFYCSSVKTCIFNKNFMHREVFNKTHNFQGKFLDIV